MAEKRDGNMIVGIAGGTAGKDSKTYKVSIPSKWANELGITKENRSVTLTFTDDKKIIIEKI